MKGKKGWSTPGIGVLVALQEKDDHRFTTWYMHWKWKTPVFHFFVAETNPLIKSLHPSGCYQYTCRFTGKTGDFSNPDRNRPHQTVISRLIKLPEPLAISLTYSFSRMFSTKRMKSTFIPKLHVFFVCPQTGSWTVSEIYIFKIFSRYISDMFQIYFSI